MQLYVSITLRQNQHRNAVFAESRQGNQLGRNAHTSKFGMNAQPGPWEVTRTSGMLPSGKLPLNIQPAVRHHMRLPVGNMDVGRKEGIVSVIAHFHISPVIRYGFRPKKGVFSLQPRPESPAPQTGSDHSLFVNGFLLWFMLYWKRSF